MGDGVATSPQKLPPQALDPPTPPQKYSTHMEPGTSGAWNYVG